MCDMQTKQLAPHVRKAISKKRFRKELGEAFVQELDCRIGKDCNLGNVVVALMRKRYVSGSPFDDSFTHSIFAKNKNRKPGEGKFHFERTEIILHASVFQNGRVDYSRLESDDAKLFRLDAIDKVDLGRVVRRQLESAMSKLARNGLPNQEYTWGIHLFASSHKEKQSLLVFRLHCEKLFPGSETDDSEAFFAVVSTSKRMEFAAFAVADHMVSKENYSTAHVFYGPEMAR
jgi:hypothetical protein